jgi:acyl-CoA synthetase (NDP forming)
VAESALRAQGAELVDILSAPANVAIVGASAKPGAVSGRSLGYLKQFGYAGKIHVVNPNSAEVMGYKTVPTIADLQQPIDLAMLNIPGAAVPQALRDLDKIGARAAVSIAHGFEEVGAPLRNEVIDITRGSTLRLIGPNCTGYMAPHARTFLSMSSFLQHYEAPAGNIAIVSQSGGMGNGLLMSLFRRGGGLSHLFTTGDELNIGCMELVAGLLPRDDVAAVGMFIEGITDSRWLEPVAELIESTGKIVAFYKTARTDAGRVAAGGHTGRVVGPADVAIAVLCDAGLREARDFEQLGDIMNCTSLFGRPRGGRVQVVCVSGASAVLAADELRASRNLSFANPSAEAAAKATEQLDPRVEYANPLDIGFNETPPISRGIRIVRQMEDVDSVLGIVTSLAHDPDELVAEIGPTEPGMAPLILTYLSPEDALSPSHLAAFAREGIAAIPTPERAIRALDLIAPQLPAPEPEPHDHDDDPNAVGLEGVAGIETERPLPLAPWRIVGDVTAALAAGEHFGYPVVVKVAGRTLQHRSDEGGVAIGITRETMPDAYAAIAAVAHKHGDVVMVQEQSAPGFEVMVSALHSPEFGAVAIVRPGGVLAELMKEQVVLAGRWSDEHRLEVLRSSTLGLVLAGYRGGKVYDVAALSALAGSAAAVLDAGNLAFLELNPVLVGTNGVSAVDALGARR